MHAACPHDGEASIDAQIKLRKHARGFFKQRLARKSTRLRRILRAQGRWPVDCRVAENHAVNAARNADAHDVVEIFKREIWRDLQQHRLASMPGARLVAHMQHARQKIIEHARLLQIAQARRVGRRDVDGEIGRDIGERFHAIHVVGDAIRRFLVGADIHADNSAASHAGLEARMDYVMPLAVEAKAIDDTFVLNETKQPRLGIAGLRERRDSANLDGAKACAQQGVRRLRALVEPGRHAEGIRKVDAERLRAQTRISRRRSGKWHVAEARDRGAVRRFRIERE